MAEAEPRYFKDPADFRAWLHKNHQKTRELLVGFYKTGSGTRSMTWPQSVAEALCYGWIDGVRKGIDDERYTIRFTPRRTTSKWSAVNVRLMGELEAAGKMTAAGRAVFESRSTKTPAETLGYRAEQKKGTLSAPLLKTFKANKAAWAFFDAQPPGYKNAIAWWVMKAKEDETKSRRLAKAIDAAAVGKRLK